MEPVKEAFTSFRKIQGRSSERELKELLAERNRMERVKEAFGRARNAPCRKSEIGQGRDSPQPVFMRVRAHLLLFPQRLEMR